ncbi:glycoprotein-N-acetylgalactosamine 3-beta-galactosyltransferase 1 [Daphnia magna]|uniref:glycoprotein-N-acetylgalactosamine 3-beta-galactosyltransferase 1 n=1 Tax=Daphnia magna TaxID=35525 RepID=UPI001E1BA01F|nr:glycoprotein-N-acetylgalactosamine 3-beta-galactosyltransferase 1 [Daphnia magna]
MFRLLRQSFVSLLVSVVVGCSVIAFLFQSLNPRFYQNNVADDNRKHQVNTSKSQTIQVIVNEKGQDLSDKVRILCWVMTSPANHETKALAVKETWGPRCNVLLFMSSTNDTKLPTVGLPVGEGRDALWGKTREAFRYVWERYQDEVDWILKADDDTYVIVENLRYFLSGFNTLEPLYFGHKFKAIVKNGFFSGGAGYALSKEAIRRFVTIGYHNASLCRKDHGGTEDVEMANCMEKLNVSAMDTRDSQGRGRFFPFGVNFHYFPGEIYADVHWYWNAIYYPPTQGRNCCSDSTISFHYIDQRTMYILDLFFYQIRPFGLVDNRPAIPEPPPDVNLTAPRWFAPPKPTTPTPPTTIPTSTKGTTTLKPNTTTSQTSAPSTKKVVTQKTVDSSSTMVNANATKKN